MESEGFWRGNVSLANRHLAAIAAMRKDAAAVERHIAAQKANRGDDEVGLDYYWAAVSFALADRPARAREELTEYEKMIASRDHVPAAGARAAVTSMVLLSEQRYAEAVTAAGTSTNHWALLAGYRALTALGRTQEADVRLQRLFDSSGWAVDAIALPIARILHGRRPGQ
jgi:hypothetical protein